MKVGIIRCQLTEDMCPGSIDFKVAREGTMAFEETGPVEIIGPCHFAAVRTPRQLHYGKTHRPDEAR